jgi:glycosyltransferase involved in cell wall biosynthesis
MKIGIVTGFSLKHSAGLEEFLLGLLEGLEHVRPTDVEYLLYTSSRSGIEGALRERGLRSFQVVPLAFGKWWKQGGLFFAPRADQYLFNGPLVPLLFAPQRSWVLVYDFAYAHADLDTVRERAKVALMDWLSGIGFRRAEKIICISEATKQELLARFRVSEEQCVVVYPGVKDLTHIQRVPVSVPANKYVFFVGTAKKRKNLLNLVRGFILAAERGLTCDLVIAGRFEKDSAYAREIMEAIARAHMESRVHILGKISDGELTYLYEHALAFTFPSQLEGFGMPVVEAMQLGVPVLTSTTSSLPEAAGDAAVLINPEDPDQIAEAIQRVFGDQGLRAELIEKGKAHARNFSWERAARELLALRKGL